MRLRQAVTVNIRRDIYRLFGNFASTYDYRLDDVLDAVFEDWVANRAEDYFRDSAKKSERDLFALRLGKWIQENGRLSSWKPDAKL
jgi:hypothetical protein